MHNSHIIVGQISGLFGVRGEVRIFDYSRSRGEILRYDPWLLRLHNGWREVSVRDGRRYRENILAKIEGWCDREAARELIGIDIAIRINQLEKLDYGEYYWHQLEGLSVVTADGHHLGTVVHLMETGANDVLVVRGEKETLIPYTSETIAEVDLPLGRIRVYWELDY